MDEGLSRAVQTIFKRLYDDGLIYRAERIINWCPRCLTALSDIEVEHSDDDGELVSIRYGEGDDVDRGRHHAGRDDARRHRRRRAPGRRALPAPGRHRGRAAADRPPDPGRRRRARRPRVRHRRGQGDPGARPERLRDRPAPRPAVAHDHGRARRDHRATARSRAWTASRPGPRSSPRCAPRAGSSPRSGPTSTRSATARAASTVVEPRLSLQWFVKVGPLAKAAGDAVRDGRVEDPPAGDGEALLRLGRQHARLVHLPPAVVGPPHPGLVRPGRRGRLRRPRRRAAGRRGLDAGRGRPRHLVLLRRCGRSPRSAGPTTPTTCERSIRPACWSPATTSSSSGSPG